MSLHEKPYVIFPDVLKRWSFQKNLRWNIIFFVLSGKVIFLFPENRILHLDEKWKMIFLKKKYMEIWYFRQMFWKDGLFNKITPEYDLSCIIWEGGIFFPKAWFFSLDGKRKMIFVKKNMEIWYFLYIRTGVTNVKQRPSARNKIKDKLIPQRNT